MGPGTGSSERAACRSVQVRNGEGTAQKFTPLLAFYRGTAVHRDLLYGTEHGTGVQYGTGNGTEGFAKSAHRGTSMLWLGNQAFRIGRVSRSIARQSFQDSTAVVCNAFADAWVVCINILVGVVR